MKIFTRVAPTKTLQVGDAYKRTLVVKHFQTDDGKTHEFTTFGEEGVASVAVIALTTDNRVVTMYQFRAGPERWMYDIPGGGANEGEDLTDAALRELHEETGYVSNDIRRIGEYQDAYKNFPHVFFIARNCRLDGDGRQPDEEEVEQGAEMRLIAIDELVENAKEGNMTDPAAVLMVYEELKLIGG